MPLRRSGPGVTAAYDRRVVGGAEVEQWRRTPSSQSTRSHLLDTAETMLAEQGLPALTIRGLTTAAGVNLATVNYVFGSKDSLLIGLQQRMFQPMLVERQERFEALAASDDVELREVVVALVAPLVAMRARHGVTAAELYRYVAAHPDSVVRHAAWSMLEPGLHRFEELVVRALPDQPQAAVLERARLVCQFAVPAALRAFDLTDSTAEADLDPLLTFIVSGLRGN